MPKISGPTIAQHVADQESAVFDAATDLFAERGVENVSMGAIAKRVGLARSSLYRYFPTKSSIVVRWFEQAMQPLIAECALIAGSGAPPGERFNEWIDRQVAFLLDPANRAMIQASLGSDDLSGDEREIIGRRHRELYTSLEAIFSAADATIDHQTIRIRVLLIVDLLRSIGELTDRGVPADLVRVELLRAVHLIAAVGQAH